MVKLYLFLRKFYLKNRSRKVHLLEHTGVNNYYIQWVKIQSLHTNFMKTAQCLPVFPGKI